MRMAKSRTTSASGRGRKPLLERAVEYFGISGRTECVAAASLFGLMIGLKLVNMTRYKFDSDEPDRISKVLPFTPAGQWLDREWPFAESLLIAR